MHADFDVKVFDFTHSRSCAKLRVTLTCFGNTAAQ